MGGNVLVAFLVTVVLWHKVKIITTNDDGAFHLGAHDGAGDDASTDGDIASEGAFFINVYATDGLLRCLEA